MDINLIGVPIFYGCDRYGANLGVDSLRKKDIIGTIRKYYNVYDLGDMYIQQVEDKDKFSFHPDMKYLDPISDANTNLAHTVYTSLKCGCFPLIVGGDHSLGVGSISGASKFYENLAVLWIDAHGDINTHLTTYSKNVHGMPLAASMGLGHEKLTNIYFDGAKVAPENVFLIGVRDLDQGEKELIEKLDMHVYTPEYIRRIGISNVVSEILEKLMWQNIDAIHLSFDLDFIDAAYVPGTGTRVKNGFSVEEAKEFLSKFVQSGMVKSMDLVELNPLLDIDDITSDIAIELIDTVFSNLK